MISIYHFIDNLLKIDNAIVYTGNCIRLLLVGKQQHPSVGRSILSKMSGYD